MTLYEKLNIPKYWNKQVAITLNNGAIYKGIMGDIINEDWEEDEEPEMIDIRIGRWLEGIILSEVKTIKLIESTTE